MAKKVIIIILALLILAGFIFAFYYFFGKSSSKNYRLTNEYLEVNLEGYTSPSFKPEISVKKSGGWEKVNHDLPINGNYYLDGEYESLRLVSIARCSSIKKPEYIKLVEYQKISEKESPFNEKVPVYQTVELNGEIKVSWKYFMDEDCKFPKNFSVTVSK